MRVLVAMALTSGRGDIRSAPSTRMSNQVDLSVCVVCLFSFFFFWGGGVVVLRADVLGFWSVFWYFSKKKTTRFLFKIRLLDPWFVFFTIRGPGRPLCLRFFQLQAESPESDCLWLEKSGSHEQPSKLG